jgi:hypothetical protein
MNGFGNAWPNKPAAEPFFTRFRLSKYQGSGFFVLTPGSLQPVE